MNTVARAKIYFANYGLTSSSFTPKSLLFMYRYSAIETEDLKDQWVVDYRMSKFKISLKVEKKERKREKER